MIETNWSRDGLRLKSDNLRRGCSLQDGNAVQGQWETMAWHRASLRRERGAVWSGWDSRTWCVLGSWNEGPTRDWAWWRLDGWGTGRPRRKEGEWGETIETNWSRDGLTLKVTISGGVVDCEIEAQCKGGVRAHGVTSLIVAAGERRRSLGVGFENMMRSWVMKWGAHQGLGVVASRWMGGGKAKAQGRGMGSGIITSHHHHVFFRICLSILAFCLDEKGCWRTSVLCTHMHEFLYISHLFHFIYFIVISNIWFCMLDVIISWHTWNCQIRKHIHTGYTHTRTHTKKKVERLEEGQERKKEEKKKWREEKGEKEGEKSQKKGGRGGKIKD